MWVSLRAGIRGELNHNGWLAVWPGLAAPPAVVFHSKAGVHLREQVMLAPLWHQCPCAQIERGLSWSLDQCGSSCCSYSAVQSHISFCHTLCPLYTSLGYCLVRKVHIFRKNNPDWCFSSALGINMKCFVFFFVFFREKKASCFFDTYAVRASAQSSNLGGGGGLGLDPPGFCPRSDQEQFSSVRYKLTDAPLERHKLQKVCKSRTD